MKYDHEILLLQGGGALGAYQAGVYEGLVEAGIEPSWVVGISIGAINAALIVGNPPERRVERLREFWRRIAVNVGPPLPAWLDSLRPAVNHMAAMSAATIGVAGFYRPRMPPASFAADGTEGALSVYDTTPLKTTLEELVDFDLINRGQVRLSLGAVNVCKGTSTYFDTKNTLIHADHVRASGALPPGFPPVTIDGDHYWDGGVVTNTPITYVVDERPLPTARIIQVDNFNAQGALPRNSKRGVGTGQGHPVCEQDSFQHRTNTRNGRARYRSPCAARHAAAAPEVRSQRPETGSRLRREKLVNRSPNQYAPLTLGLGEGLRIFTRDY